MAHKDIGAPKSFSSDNTVRKLGNFDKGVVLCKYDRELGNGQSPYIKNMIYDRNMLRTRFGQKSIESDIQPKGELHSHNEEIFFGSYVFHIGSGLYAFDGESVRTLYGEMPDCDSFIFEMDSVLYVFCRNVRIFMVTRQFEVSEHVIEDTKIMTEAKYNLSTYLEEDVPDNMIMFRVCVDYLERDAGIEYYVLPTECDTDYPIIFTQISTGLHPSLKYTVDGNRINLADKYYMALNISYVPKKESQYRNFDKIFGCSTACTYGGGVSGGTRVFFTGNDDYPGYYFYSELLSPLNVKKLSYDILGNGSGRVTAFAKQKGELVAFCEDSIYRMIYTFDEYSGANFMVSEISTGIGCDIPGSVKLIDNRLVFAKSGLGIFIIVSSEYTDELNIRRISGNINGNSGEGFLFEDKESIRNCISSDIGGRYMLVCPSGNAYVWDYGNSPYVVYDSPLDSERELSWYYFDGIYENSLFGISGTLFGTRENRGNIEFVCFSDDEECDFGGDIMCMYKSCELDNGEEFFKKNAKQLRLGIVGNHGTRLLVYVFADNYPVLDESYTFDERTEDGEKLRRVTYNIPGYAAYKFTVLLVCPGGKTGLYDAEMKFGGRINY